MITIQLIVLNIFILLAVSHVQGAWWLATEAPVNITKRTDDKFVDDSLPAGDWNTTAYSREEWDRLIENNVNLSDFDTIQNQVKERMTTLGIQKNENGNFIVQMDTGEYKTVTLRNLNEVMEAVLLMYTLGYPLHSGALFYKDFNRDTRHAIEKILPFSQYNYAVEYALIDRAHKRKSYRLYNINIWRGVRETFTYKKNEKFRFNQFASASSKKHVAVDFLEVGQGTIYDLANARVLPMWEYSQYSRESEYLVHPFEVFEVYDAMNCTSWNVYQYIQIYMDAH